MAAKSLRFAAVAPLLAAALLSLDTSGQHNDNMAHHHHNLHPPATQEIEECLSPDLEEKERSQCRFFAAVIDAGSTGTRLHLFEFSHSVGGKQASNKRFKLESETYKEIKPGVSCYAKTPELAAESVRELLMVAKRHIPSALWPMTPITFKATAGVRLLSEREADIILSAVEAEVLNSGFLVDDEAVGVLSGTDEGVFGWFTLNFLLDSLQDAIENKAKAAAALDLGGGSTQVTFVPHNFDTALKGLARQKYSHRLKVFEHEFRLYTHSYLGNGLVASRLGIAKLSTPEWRPDAAPALRTHCLPPKFVLDDWDYAGNVWLISATADASFETCLEAAKQYVLNVTDVKRVPELAEREELFLFGYFYDRAVQAALVDYSLEHAGGVAAVGDFRAAAQKACAMPAEAIGPEPWQPWQCLDLSYIYTLLHHGYGLPDAKRINLVKKLRTMEVSWALGTGFHLLNSYHDHLARERRDQDQRELQASLERDRAELDRHRRSLETRAAELDAREPGGTLARLERALVGTAHWLVQRLSGAFSSTAGGEKSQSAEL